MAVPRDAPGLTALLAHAGFVAADEEALELLERAGGDGDHLDALVARRLTGEPLAWITGTVAFCGLTLRVDPGVYVPRWQTEGLARRAARRLPPDGTAVDVGTGCGAIAAVLRAARPHAHVLATDVDPAAVACARANGVAAHVGDLTAPLPAGLAGGVDLLVGVVPYVPTPELGLLQRDTFAFETALSYDGGDDGTRVLRRALAAGRDILRPGGTVLLELGGDQATLLAADLRDLGFDAGEVLVDDDEAVRGLEARLRAGGGA